jgi:hypothetical protein
MVEEPRRRRGTCLPTATLPSAAVLSLCRKHSHDRFAPIVGNQAPGRPIQKQSGTKRPSCRRLQNM